jgi:hypothetical protein
MADDPQKYIDNPQLYQDLIAAAGGPEAANRSLTALGYNIPGQDNPMAGNKDPLVQEFLDMIKAGSQQAGPDSEFASGRFMDDPPMLLDMDDPATRRDETDPLEMGMLSGRDRRDMSKTMPTRTEREIMATEPGQDVQNIQMAAAGDFPRPSEMQDAAQPQGTGLFGAQGIRTTAPKEETAQLLEEKSEVKEEPVDEIVEVEVDEEPGFIESQPIDFKTNYTQAVKTNILNPEAQAAVQKAVDVAQAQYDFFDKNHDIKIDIDALTKNIDKDITLYTNKIDEIAQEEISPPFEGDTIRKVLAVIGAALGAAASTFGGTPNYALQIIDKAIDREQQKKLKSKEMRILSAREQRRILQEQRGQMLQFALNKTNQAIQSAQMKGQAAQNLASLQMLQGQLMQAAQQNIDNVVAGSIKTYMSVMAGMMTKQGSKGRNYIPGLGVITGNNSKEDLTRIKKDGEKFTKGYYSIMQQREKALKLIGELEKEGIVETVLQQGMSIKGLKGEQYKKLEQLSTMIFLTYKNDIAKVGQAMTAPEQAIVERVMPQQTLATVTLGELQTALESLPELMATEAYGLQMGMGIMPTQRDINFQEIAGMYGQQQPTKEVPGVKKVTD